MKTIRIAGFTMPAHFATASFAAPEAQALKMPEPVKEHEWLQQLVGDWDLEVETLEPGKPPVKSSGTESVHSVGGFWVVAESHGTFMGEPFHGVLTLGYDPDRRRYTGAWISSMSSYLMTYEGSADPGGKALTLESEGPCPGTGKITKVREVLEIRSPEERLYTSFMQSDDGSYYPGMVINYRRRK